MKKYHFLFVTLTLMMVFSACSPKLTPFTQKLYTDNKWGENELKRIQFYLSEDIILQRQVTEGSTEIVSGEIKMVRGKKVEEIRIRKGTPGVYLFSPKGDSFAIAFEEGSNSRYLTFGPNPKRKGVYVLLASEWDEGRGKVNYDSKMYYTDEESAFAALLVDLTKISKTQVNAREAKGRKVN